MKFQVTVQQLSVFQQTLDIAIKQVGLSGLYTIVELVQLLENPIEETDKQAGSEGPFTYEISEEQIKKFDIVFDIAIKAVGLKGATDIVILAQSLQNPLHEEAEGDVQEGSAE